jgi:Ketopantoate reductase PanE/ApbA C terminal
VKELIAGVIDELLELSAAHGCKFSADFKQRTMDEMTRPSAGESIMWQDYVAKRPMEVETYLGSPIKLAHDAGIAAPRIEALYAVLHHLNIVNRQRPKIADGPVMPPPGSPTTASPLPRMSAQNGGRSVMNGGPNGMPNGMLNGNGMPPRPRLRNPGGPGGPGGPGMRRPMNGGPPNGFRPSVNGPPNGYGSRQASRRGSMDGTELEEFSHLVVYDDIPEGGESSFVDASDLTLRERELQLRQRELLIREQELRMRRGPPGPRRGPPMRSSGQVYDDEDDDDDWYDPNAPASNAPVIDPDNFDMMSVTSRKNRKTASSSQSRRNPDFDGPGPRGGRHHRPNMGRNRSSQIVSIAGVGENIMDDPLMGCSSNRYGNVDRGAMHAESRANSLTSVRLDELQQYGPPGGGPPMGMNGGFPRRSSQSPGNPYSPSIRMVNGRPSPPNGYPGPPMNGRPSPPDGVRQPVPRYPPGHGNAVAPQQVEQHIGVSALQPPKPKNVRSLTGSASASAGSGDSEPSAHSSQSSFGQRPPIGVR